MLALVRDIKRTCLQHRVIIALPECLFNKGCQFPVFQAPWKRTAVIGVIGSLHAGLVTVIQRRHAGQGGDLAGQGFNVFGFLDVAKTDPIGGEERPFNSRFPGGISPTPFPANYFQGGAVGNPAAPALYVVATSVVTLIAIVLLPETGRDATLHH